MSVILPDLYKNLLALASKKSKEYNKFLKKLIQRQPRELDQLAYNAHQEAFKKIDCLKCANCCKTTSPIFRMIDIERIAKHLRIKPQTLMTEHLHLDADGDYVLNSSPCTFLGEDNYCSIYEARPNACREYPHTDRKNFHQVLNLTMRNQLICPAVSFVVGDLLQRIDVEGKKKLM